MFFNFMLIFHGLLDLKLIINIIGECAHIDHLAKCQSLYLV